MKTDTSEKGLESLIVTTMTGRAVGESPPPGEGIALRLARYGGTGWILGISNDYDREYAMDPQAAEALDLGNAGPTRQKFLARLQHEITKRGVIDVLRHGVKHGPHHLDLFYGTPTPGNTKAEEDPAFGGQREVKLYCLAGASAHRLKKDEAIVFDSIIVVTDRKVLDKQIRDTIKQFAQVGATIGHAEHSGNLREFIASGKKIIISTVQKFPFILDEIGTEHRSRKFAIIIDEAHSSQGGRTSAAMALALAEGGTAKEDETPEDRINRIMEARKMCPTQAILPSPPHQRTRRWRSSVRRTRTVDRSSIGPSIATR